MDFVFEVGLFKSGSTFLDLTAVTAQQSIDAVVFRFECLCHIGESRSHLRLTSMNEKILNVI